MVAYALKYITVAPPPPPHPWVPQLQIQPMVEWKYWGEKNSKEQSLNMPHLPQLFI